MPPIMEQGYQENYYANWNDPWGGANGTGNKNKQNWLHPNRSELYQQQQQQQNTQQQLPGYYDSYYPQNNVPG